MVSIAHASVMAELTALQKDLERVTAQASATTRKGKPATIRRESMVARLADYQGMKAKVGLYAEMLGMRQQEIARSLDTLQQTAPTRARGNSPPRTRPSRSGRWWPRPATDGRWRGAAPSPFLRTPQARPVCPRHNCRRHGPHTAGRGPGDTGEGTYGDL